MTLVMWVEEDNSSQDVKGRSRRDRLSGKSLLAEHSELHFMKQSKSQHIELQLGTMACAS
jgi:hypothetical protein